MNSSQCGNGKEDGGSALIVVLALIALATVLATSSTVISRKSKYLTASLAQKTYSAYVAEGVSARVQWLIAYDRRIYPQRILGAAVPKEEKQRERYIADGRIKEIDYYGVKVTYRIFDMASGIDISGPNSSAKLSSYMGLYDEERLERYKALINRFEDYIDSDALLQINSLEAEAYISEGLYPLPRNRQMEYKEELLWIPGALEFFPPNDAGRLSQIRVIPPKNLPRAGVQSNFFNANKEMIMALCGMNESDAQAVIDARELYFEEGNDISSYLELGVFTLLRSKFSFNESGFYSIEIDSSPNRDRAGKKLYISSRISNQFTNPGIRYYEWLSY